MSDETKPKEAKRRKKAADLDLLTKMRVKLWFGTVLKRAGCSVSRLPNAYYFELSYPEFHLYAHGEREPSASTLYAVAHAHKVGKESDKPFLETRAVFEVGPEGAALWEVLEGGLAGCEKAVECAFLAGEPIGGAGFGHAVANAYASLLSSEQAAEAREFMADRGKPSDFGYLYEVMRWFLVEELEHPMITNNEENPYPMKALVGCLGLWRISQENKSLRRECDFLAVGAAAILKKRLEVIKPELEEHWKSLMMAKVSNAF